MARSQYALPSDTGKPNREDPRGLTPYIRETAKKYGVDPEVALKVAKSEGLSNFRSGVTQKDGTQEPSFGAFQLYTGGGLGNQFKKDTGLDPADPANEKATIDYALKTAAKTGWGPWHGAKNTGIGEFDGISGGQAASSGSASSDTAATATAGDTVAGTHISTATPDTGLDTSPTATGAATGDWLDKLKDPKGNASAGLGEAISGLGQAVAGTGMKNMYATPPPAPVPVAMPTAPRMAPMVDPALANQQRQQLAVALQRLNSGRLV
jgi:hypothetical protein